jgi:hypothetical protein
MEGGELFARIEKRQANPYTERDAARFISMIVKAIAHLHAMDMVSLSYLCSLYLMVFILFFLHYCYIGSS